MASGRVVGGGSSEGPRWSGGWQQEGKPEVGVERDGAAACRAAAGRGLKGGGDCRKARSLVKVDLGDDDHGGGIRKERRGRG